MFTPKTDRIKEIAIDKKDVVDQLDGLFSGPTCMYIDYANVRPWSTKLGWHVDIKRLKQFLDSFSTIGPDSVNFYNGYLVGNERSEKEKTESENAKYVLRTKPVKIMSFSIDVSSIRSDATILLDQFVKRALLKNYDISTIEYLNARFGDMNKRGILAIEDMKCNFDVEIGVDMLLDCERNNAEVFALWSGDSDFADPIEKLMSAGKKVVLFATARKVSRELSELTPKGLMIFDIQKIRDFICWKKELERKGDPSKGAPKL
ncbi:MAG TPA: NYN domain-containing protein [Candidatus Paceibacterota bacterium]